MKFPPDCNWDPALVGSSVTVGTDLLCRTRVSSNDIQHSKRLVDPATVSPESLRKACAAYLPGREGPSSNLTYRFNVPTIKLKQWVTRKKGMESKMGIVESMYIRDGLGECAE